MANECADELDPDDAQRERIGTQKRAEQGRYSETAVSGSN